MAILQSTTFSSTGYLQLPVGIASTRPTEPASTVVQFTATGATTWTCPANIYSIDVLVVAGGGGGGAWVPGGGGAGGVIYRENYPVNPGTVYNLSVGVGGNGSYNPGSYVGMPNATNGGNSTFDTLTAVGGGFGGSWSSFPPSSGGSGGGSGYGGYSTPYTTANTGKSLQLPGTGTAGQGFPGGQSLGDVASPNGYATGGGGGAGGPGLDAGFAGTGELTTGSWGQYGKSGDGGPGIPCNITGAVVWYGGGGGGGVHGPGGGSPNGQVGRGGIGGGGTGLAQSTGTAASGTANTGGGGGGGGNSGGSVSRGGNGGSGIVVIRYVTAGNYANALRPGALRVNPQIGLEYYTGMGTWRPMSMPFLTRTIITTAYMSGGYKDGVAWNNVNRCNNSTDTTYNLGDGSVSRSHNYQNGACGQNIAYILGSGNAHGTPSNVVAGFNMRTETAYSVTSNLTDNRYNQGVLFREHYTAWVTGGGSALIEEYNLTNETRTAGYTGFYSGGSWAMSHENFGLFYWEEDQRAFQFSTRTFNTRSGGVGAHSQQKSVQSKSKFSYAGHEGSYNAGNNLRRTNMYSDTTSGFVPKPLTNCGEENFTMGQDWQYCIGEYDGAQNSNAWKFYYSTESGFSTGATTQPKGQLGCSSGTCFWRN